MTTHESTQVAAAACRRAVEAAEQLMAMLDADRATTLTDHQQGEAYQHARRAMESLLRAGKPMGIRA